LEDSSHYNASTYSVKVDPVFVSASAANYRPLSSSACVNAGINVGLAVDFDGTFLPQGGYYDIGAFEFTEDPVPPGVASATAAVSWAMEVPGFALQQITTPGNYLDSIVDPGGAGHYLSISAWSAARGGLEATATCVSEEVLPRAICQCTNGSADSASVIMSATDWGETSSEYHPIVFVDEDFRQGFQTPTSGNMYRLIVGGDPAFECQVDHTEIIGLPVMATANADYDHGLSLRTCEGVKVDRCIVTMDAGTASQVRGFSEYNCSTGSNYYRNCLAYGFGENLNSKGFWVHQRTGGTSYYHHCAAVDTNDGFYAWDSSACTVVVENCMAWNGGTTPTNYIAGPVDVFSGDYNSYNGTAGMGTNPIDLSATSATDVFLNYTASDFRIADGTCAAASVCPSLYADAALTVQYDIEGNMRPSAGTVAVGVSEPIGASVSAPVSRPGFGAGTGALTITSQAAFVLSTQSVAVTTTDTTESLTVAFSLSRKNFTTDAPDPNANIRSYQVGSRPARGDIHDLLKRRIR
jgi:hypothetical protein